jgi:hypothetical protein
MRSLFTRIAIFFCFVLLFNEVTAQVGIGTNSPNASAALDISPSTPKGILIPRMTAAQRTAISSPATGLMVYQTDGTPGFFVNSGTPASPSWTQMVSVAPGTSGNVLTSNGTGWVSQVPSGGTPSILSFSTATYSINESNVQTDLYLTYTASADTEIELPRANLVPAGKSIMIRSGAGNFLNVRVKSSTTDKIVGYYSSNGITNILSDLGFRLSYIYLISDGSSGWWSVQMLN